MIDRHGSLFNKEAVLKALRDKAVDGVPLPQRLAGAYTRPLPPQPESLLVTGRFRGGGFMAGVS